MTAPHPPLLIHSHGSYQFVRRTGEGGRPIQGRESGPQWFIGIGLGVAYQLSKLLATDGILRDNW